MKSGFLGKKSCFFFSIADFQKILRNPFFLSFFLQEKLKGNLILKMYYVLIISDCFSVFIVFHYRRIGIHLYVDLFRQSF